MKYTYELAKIGLTTDQAAIYETLIENPALTARLVAVNSGVHRELAYIVLGQLESLGLIERLERPKKVMLFRALHPKHIQKIVETKNTEAEKATEAYNKLFQKMLLSYNQARHHPHVSFYEGLDGLAVVYKMILDEAKKVNVIRSRYDYDNVEVRAMVTSHIAAQAEKGIESYVLSPLLPHMDSTPHMYSTKKKSARKIIPVGKFDLPAQIIIYNNKVCITSFTDEIVTTITESPAIAETFRVLFAYIWDSI
jgi:sugar-specific transcriptional regulator TrmB